MEPDREARLNNAFMLLSKGNYIDELVCERFNAMDLNLELW
jgi:hypothetical protein